MQVPASPRAIQRLGIITALALLGSLLISGSAVAAGSGGTVGHDRFQPSASDGGEGTEAGETRDPARFEAEAAESPVKGDASLFSQCRFEPMASATYPSFASNEHDVVTNDTQFTFVDGVTHCYNPQNESNIVINPTDRNNIVTSANDYRGTGVCVAYVSKDGGDTWHDYFMPGWTSFTTGNGVFIHTGCGGDPVMAFGPDGTLYYAGVTFNVDKFPRQKSGVAVSKSTDGGVTWSKPVMVVYNSAPNFFFDKPWISVSNDGTVNLTWTKFYQGPVGVSYLASPIQISQSHDGGKHWTLPHFVSDPSHPYDQTGTSLMAPDGTLYVTYEGADPDSGYTQDVAMVAISTDGGLTFTNHKGPRIYDDLDCYPIQLPGEQDRQTLSGEQMRLFPGPLFTIDPTTGQLVLTWTDDQGAGNCGTGADHFVGTTSNQVKVSTSWDGITWDTKAITSTAPDKTFSSVGANDGVIAVGYYTRDYAYNDTGNTLCEAKVRDTDTGDITPLSTENVCLDWAVKTSTDGGVTWSDQIRVTARSSNPFTLFAGGFIGDYTGTAVDDQGKVYSSFTDFRGNPDAGTSPNQDMMVATLPE